MENYNIGVMNENPDQCSLTELDEEAKTVLNDGLRRLAKLIAVIHFENNGAEPEFNIKLGEK